jgi:hypothetical protein
LELSKFVIGSDQWLAALEQNKADGNMRLAADEAFAHAAVLHHLETDNKNVSTIMHWLAVNHPAVLDANEITVLQMLSSQQVGELNEFAVKQFDRCLDNYPEHPGVLSAAVEYYRRIGDVAQYEQTLRKLADLAGYEDDSRKQKAAYQYAEYVIEDDPQTAANYYWQAYTWWYTSGNGGDFGDRILEALDRLPHPGRLSN